MKTLYLLTILLLVISDLSAQNSLNDNSPLKIGKNYRIYPSNVAQTEVLLVRSPLDQNTMFVACNTLNFIPFFISEGIYTTTNGGVTWQGNDTCTGDPIAFHGGDPGISIDKNGTFIITRLGRSPFVGLYSHYSHDQGQTWSAQKVISTDDLERAALTTDANPATSFFGRTYAAWVKFATPFPLMFAYTDNGAQTWTAPKQVNNPPARCAGGDLAIGPNGEVYLCWAGVTDVSPFKEVQVGFASSSNGGGTWNVIENAFSVNGITGILSNKNNIRVNGLPSIAVDTTKGPRRGWIYIVTTQKAQAPAGADPDIILFRSADGGSTWSAGIRVNQDALNNGKDQYFPNIHIDKSGAVDIIFYDNRTTTTDSTGVFLARSLDGGDSWTEYEISDHHFRPYPIGGLGQGYQGDIIDLTSTDSKIWAVWMDNSSGDYQIWTVPIDFSSIGGVDETGQQPNSSALYQNYPNPFRSATKIGYRVTSSGFVSLKVFDIFGIQVAEPVKEVKSPGYYEVTVKSDDLQGHNSLNSGIFFYRFTVNDRVETGRMVSLK
ncbi:MAG: sialidase family protein [Bacteroidales bacterium]|nr:sialidase family protein [Bacteroidales bacterium]